MPEKYLLDIPVYRCPLDKYIIETEDFRKKTKDYLVGIPAYQGLNKKLEESIDRTVLSIMMAQERPWIFNEIVAYLRLFTSGNQIRVEDFTVKEKITKRLRKKTFLINGKVFGLHIKPTWNDERISIELLEELESIRTSEKFKKRYIDLGEIKNLAPFIRWGKLLNL